mmetsp:Transcript_6453/g.12521  ORF Transcript_6453/g.12521 Transcript_6453/m.12521 type:complete len:623 (-) Transcript_6453:556-2424(-)
MNSNTMQSLADSLLLRVLFPSTQAQQEGQQQQQQQQHYPVISSLSVAGPTAVTSGTNQYVPVQLLRVGSNPVPIQDVGLNANPNPPSHPTAVPVAESAVRARPPPAFMAQDEAREFQSVSIHEMMEIQSDLSGLTLGPSPAATADAVDDALERLDAEIFKLPLHETAVYLKALSHHSDVVDRDFRLSFLERDNFDARLAAQRIAGYWSLKWDVFGEDKCFLPMNLSEGGALEDDFEVLKESFFEIVLPRRDAQGRAILYLDGKLWHLPNISSKQVLRGIFYVYHTVCQDPDTRRRGAVILGNYKGAKGAGLDSFDTNVFCLGGRFMQVVPLRVRSFHVCHPSAFMNYAFFPILKFFLGRELRLRLRTHYGSDESVLKSLEAYGMPSDVLPMSAGGSLDYDVRTWFTEQLFAEKQPLSESQANGQASAGISECDVEEPPKKRAASSRSRNTNNQGNGNRVPLPALVASAAQSTPASTNQKKRSSSKRGKGERRGRGKPSDPRMSKAIAIKQAKTSVSLYCALVAGGFVFKEDSKLNDMVDEDGITLTQRKNNLCRRMRLEKRKREVDLEEKNASHTESLHADHAVSSPATVAPGIRSPAAEADAAEALLGLMRESSGSGNSSL